jgi:signal transduction histidine kinase
LSFGVLLLLTASMIMLMISAQRAQRLARRQIEFVAGVSHELRTPLTVISSAAENLADGVVAEQDRIKQYGKLIKVESERLADMVEQALEFAGAQSGQRKFNLRPVDVGELVGRALTACRLQIEDGGFTVETAIAPIQVNADSAALTRALQNLISNAVKYSGDNRWIGIRAGLAVNGTDVEIAVEDHGLGIASSELPHVFEPFYRAQVSVEAQIHGSGLGLSLVKHIVEAHGGRVSVNSTLDQGSTFTLHLPIATQPEPVPSNMVIREA